MRRILLFALVLLSCTQISARKNKTNVPPAPVAPAPFVWTAQDDSQPHPARIHVKLVGDSIATDQDYKPQVFPMADYGNIQLSSPDWEPASGDALTGTLTLTYDLPTIQLVFIRNLTGRTAFPVPCVPGEEVTLSIDVNAMKLFEQSGDKSIKYYTVTNQKGGELTCEHPAGYTGPEGYTTEDLLARASNPDVALTLIAQRDKAAEVLRHLGALDEVADADVAAVPALYRELVSKKYEEYKDLRRQMAEGHGGTKCDLPDVPAAEMIKTIVSKYKGKAVFVDLWATWCGPCRMGIKAMQPHHDDFSPKDVQFVYITDESSPLDKWNSMVVGMPGDHYRLKTMQGLEPAINGIPRYLIFNREGELVHDAAGFGPGCEEGLLTELRKAMQ